MPNFGVLPLSTNVLASTTITTNTTTAVFSLSPSSSYRMTVQFNTVSGTLPTMQVGLYSSSDTTAGATATTFHGILNTAQMTTTGLGVSVLFRPYLGIGDAATTIQSPLLGSAVDFTNTNTATVANGPFNPASLKLRIFVGGTTPSFSAVQVFIDQVPQDLSD